MIHITDKKDLSKIDRSKIALDLETTGFDPQRDTIIGIAIADSKNEYFIEPSLIAELAAFAATTKILHNFKFDYRFLYKAGIDFRETPTEDTLVMSHLVDENGDHGLEHIASVYLGTTQEHKTNFWKKYKNAKDAPKEELMQYACEDVRLTYDLHFKLYNIILDSCKKSLYNHVMTLSKSLLNTEVMGLKIDMPYLIDIGTSLKEKINVHTIEMRKITDGYCTQWEMQEWSKEIDKRKSPRGKANVPRPEFSFDSNKQLGELLYDIIELPEQKSKENRRTVDDAALSKLNHPVIKPLKGYREANKLYGTYVEGILERSIDGYIYPTFNTCGTVTGRISHQNPNMGNLPRDGGLRGIFIPADRHSFVAADYAQLEICMAAHFSQDSVLIDAIFQGVSMHDITSKALNIDRQKAKTLNFGILYGASKWKVKEIFQCEEYQAEAIIIKFFQSYPGLKKIIDYCHKAVENDEDIKNPFGRTRNFRGQWSNKRELERCKRQAFNSLLQGTGGDITSRAFYLISDDLKKYDIGRALFTVHDEVLIEVRDDAIETAKEIISKRMIEVGKEIDLKVPLSIDISSPKKRWEK